ncbi:MAG: VgrG-related protein [Chloroflexi bacterium]|nr:VgrG-related protein [Chloroflexota bacterium]
MTTRQPNISQFFIQIEGRDLAPEVMAQLDDAVVEDDLEQPAMFMLRFNDPQLKLIDGDLFKLGAEVHLGAADVSGKGKPVMIGEIVALEPCLEQGNSVLVVRGYDRLHRLLRGSRIRTFLNRTDDDIVRQIAREAGLQVEIDSVGAEYPYVIQHNLTDLAFLRERAARIGYQVRVDGRTLHFRRATARPPQAPALAWGDRLTSFRVRLAAAAQPGEVQVRGWDPSARRPILGVARAPSAPPQVNEDQTAGQVAERTFGNPATLVVSEHPVASQGEAERLAQAILDQVGGDYLTAEGECRGEPALRAGVTITIGNLGRRLSGTYFVTSTRHTYTPRDGYTTTFFVSGQRPTGLLAAITPPPAIARFAGVAVGLVTNVSDPEELGRVRLSFPWLDESHESDWARLALPWAGAGRGIFAALDVGDEVLVAFEHGDMARPYVVGCLWNGRDKPPRAAVAEGRKLILLHTAGERVITLDDGGRKLILTTPEHSITLDDAARTVEVMSGSQRVVLDGAGRSVRIESDNTLELSGAGGALRIGPSGVELSSKATLDVRANAVLSINGSLVKINS